MWSCLCWKLTSWLPRQQTISTTTNNAEQPLPPSTSAHLPSKHRLITTSPTHHIDTLSPLRAAARRVAIVSLGHDNQRPDAQWMNGGGGCEPTMMVTTYDVITISVPIQVSLHKYSPPFPCLTLNPGATSLSATWQPNGKRPMSSFVVIGLTTRNPTNDSGRSRPVLISQIMVLVFFGVGTGCSPGCPSLGVKKH